MSVKNSKRCSEVDSTDGTQQKHVFERSVEYS